MIFAVPMFILSLKTLMELLVMPKMELFGGENLPQLWLLIMQLNVLFLGAQSNASPSTSRFGIINS